MDLQKAVIGTWSMVEAWNIDAGKKSYPWGKPSAGYWVFDASGHFGLMISPNPPLPIPTDPFSSTTPPTLQDQWLSPNPPWEVPYSLLMETFSSANPYAYFGSYTVEPDPRAPDCGTFNLSVFADIMRGYTGTVQQRPFRLNSADIIEVGVPDQYIRKLKRLT